MSPISEVPNPEVPTPIVLITALKLALNYKIGKYKVFNDTMWYNEPSLWKFHRIDDKVSSIKMLRRRGEEQQEREYQ